MEGEPTKEQAGVWIKENYMWERYFSAREQATQFVIDFWTSIDLRIGERLQHNLAAGASLEEFTHGDRTVITENNNGDKWIVTVYRNHDTDPLSQKAISILNSL